MFKNLIVPIDGSDLSQKSLKKVKELAKVDGAKVTLVYVSDPLPPIAYADSTMGVPFSDAAHKKSVRIICSENSQEIDGKNRQWHHCGYAPCFQCQFI